MPYGYAGHRIKNGDNPITVKSHIVVINQFFAFVKAKYNGETPDLLLIRQNDVWDFLNQQYVEKKLGRLTVEKKQSHLKVFFDYLYTSNQIKVDHVCKINYFKNAIPRRTEVEKQKISYTYHQFLEMEEKVLDSDLNNKSKLLMIFYMKGIALHDMYALEDSNFETLMDKTLKLTYRSRLGYDATLIISEVKEIQVINNAITSAIENDTTYLMYSYDAISESYGPGNSSGRSNFTRAISKVLDGISLKADSMRVALVSYLYYEKDLTEEQIANMLGRSLYTVVRLRKQSLARIEGISYNDEKQLALDLT